MRTCGVPTIKNVMRNLTLQPGDRAMFRCKVDMKCMVSYIQWYHEMNNGDHTGKLKALIYSSVHFRKCQTASHGGNCGHTLQLHDQQGEGGRGRQWLC